MFFPILKLVIIVGCLFVSDEILKVLNLTVICTLAMILRLLMPITPNSE